MRFIKEWLSKRKKMREQLCKQYANAWREMGYEPPVPIGLSRKDAATVGMYMQVGRVTDRRALAKDWEAVGGFIRDAIDDMREDVLSQLYQGKEYERQTGEIVLPPVGSLECLASSRAGCKEVRWTK